MSVIACIWNASCEFVTQISAPLHRVLARVTRVRARARTHCSAQICRLTEPESLLEFATNLLRYLHWQVLRYLRQFPVNLLVW